MCFERPFTYNTNGVGKRLHKRKIFFKKVFGGFKTPEISGKIQCKNFLFSVFEIFYRPVELVVLLVLEDLHGCVVVKRYAFFNGVS